jgi:hypothetical protein
VKELIKLMLEKKIHKIDLNQFIEILIENDIGSKLEKDLLSFSR